MADFNWYLNRQGLRGLTGEKGDQGFSPYFTVEESTANQYRLRVHNENDSFVTENLRGNAIEIRNPDGNYIKYDHTTGDFYVDDADYATVDSEGQIILATINDVVTGNETKAVTPALLLDSLSQILVNTDSNLSITQNQDNSLTEINLADEVIHPNLKYAPNNNYLITGDIRYNNPIRVTKGILDDTGRRGCTFDLMYDTNHFSRGSQGLILSNSIVNLINSTRSDLNSEISNRANADTEIRASISTERLERQSETSALSESINAITNTMVTLNGYQTISNKTIDGKLNFRNPETYIMAESASDFTINANNYLYLQAKDNVGVYIGDNKANFNFNDDGNIHVWNAADGFNYFLKQNTVTAGDNITIEQDGRGIKISSTGGGGSSYVLPIASTNTLGGIKAGNWLKVNEQTGKLECGELTYSQYQSALGYTFISKTTLENVLANRPSGGATIDDEDVSTTKVFSSSKTSELVGEVGNDLQDLTQRVNNIESLKVPNVVIIGEPTIQNGQVSDIDQDNHLQFPFILDRQGRNWECNLSFTTGDDITNQQNIIDSRCSVALAVRSSALILALSTNGQTFTLGEHSIPNFTLQPNTTYYVQISYTKDNGYVLKADVNPINDSSPYTSIGYANTPVAARTLLIGSDGNSFSGTLDLNKWSLRVDNELIWLGMDNVGQAVSANVSLSNINREGEQTILNIISNNTIEYQNSQNFSGGIFIYDEHKTRTTRLAEFRITDVKKGKNGTTNLNDRLYTSVPSTASHFYKDKYEIDFSQGFNFNTWVSAIPSLDDFVAGDGIELTKDEENERITISCPAIGDINSILDAINGEVI